MWQVDKRAEQADSGTSRTVGGLPSSVLSAAGNQAVVRMAAAQPRIVAQMSELGTVFHTVTGFLSGQELEGSVGVDGVNDPRDVAIVTRMLLMAGYVGLDIDAEITQFQREVLKWSKPDGRIDPGGRTFKALKEHQPKSSGKANPWGDPQPDTAAAPAGIEEQLRRLEELSAKPTTNSSNDEETNSVRKQLVSGIAAARAMVETVTDPAKKAEYFRRLNAVAPFYSQGYNEKIIGNAPKLTCNLTVASMCLEQLGKSAADYTDPYGTLAAIKTWATGDIESSYHKQMDFSRLADFMQLVAVAEKLGKVANPTDEQINAARIEAISWVDDGYPVLQALFRGFGVSAETKSHDRGTELSAIGAANTLGAGGIWDRIDRREAAARGGQPDDASVVEAGRAYDAKDAVVRGRTVRAEDIELEGYKKWAMDTFVPILNAGRPVAVGQWNHWMRLEAIDDDVVTIDDPSSGTRSNRKFAWEEARAVGLFWISLVVKL
ncbi:hypothetical protein JOF56_007277 [Kibdelosporangium banguiense]|uniref:Peptidoglycan binding domain-containing protein n=1 Tax=Kibdelosporangium banguiense TaxID=1365924 RepID=A0ABS4TR63_9PSEU|nr:hypothetical protein [Kibdelosporangium banguiense]MBP2326892.1 hypothetical protein [Kibdelosporangium banguiense]